MGLQHKNLTAATLAAFVVVVFLTTAAGWAVPFIGHSPRWAALIILLLGLDAFALGAPGSESDTHGPAALVLTALLLTLIAVATASLLPVGLLVIDVLALVIAASTRDLRHGHRKPLAM